MISIIIQSSEGNIMAGNYVRTDEIKEKQRIKMLLNVTEEIKTQQGNRARENFAKRKELGLHDRRWVDPVENVCIEYQELFLTKNKNKKFCSKRCYHKHRSSNIKQYLSISKEGMERIKDSVKK